MRRTTELPLLLAPAGGEEAFLAAVSAGADAIYLGGSAYNARAYAENFSEETLARCVKLAHAHGIKVHVTMNTLLTDRELPDALAWAGRLWRMGVDALIVADMGLCTCMRACFPAFALHASTQMSIHSSAGAEEISDLGFEVVVTARELDRENLAAVIRRAPSLAEGFVHGALCVSYSGQCLFSSVVGGRSGNRGECAQPCRLPFGHGYPLSLKDMSLASHIPALIEDGVACLKIEGRMKSPSYVWGVAKIYRRLLDERRAATEEEKATLARIFSRDGHTDGYYTGQRASMTGIRREEDKRDSQTAEETIPPPRAVSLTAECRMMTGEPSMLTLTDPQGHRVCVYGETPSPAIRAPLTASSVTERLCKMGGTPYVLSPEKVTLTLDEGLNLSPAAINALRRAAVEALTDPNREEITPRMPVPPTHPFDGADTTALFMRGDVWDDLGEEDRRTFDVAFVPLREYAHRQHKPKGVWLPPVIFDSEEESILAMLSDARAAGATHALCGNPAQVKYAREAGLTVIGDHRLNITNLYAADYWARHGVSDAVLSPELTPPQMRDIGGRAIVYGRIPLMLTERCYASADGTCTNCKEACHNATLTDRRGVVFPLMRLPEHRNLILNSLPTYMGDKREDIPHGVRAHMIFSTEDANTCSAVIRAWKAGASLDCAVRRFVRSGEGMGNKETPVKQGATSTENKKTFNKKRKSSPPRRGNR